MIFFLGLKILLKQKDDEMGRGKRKKKYTKQNGADKEAELQDVVSKKKNKHKKKNSDPDDDNTNYSQYQRPFESIKLLPPRNAQEGIV